MIELLFVGGIALFLIAAVLAPAEALGWWAGWFGRDRDLDAVRQQLAEAAAKTGAESPTEHFVVYLSGIGSATGAELMPEEIPLIEYLQAHLPRTVVVHDVFPYSVMNMGLTGERFMSRFWKLQDRLRMEKNSPLLGFLINMRNLFQVAVSSDSRYGPVYNLGVAKEIVLSLLRHGYQLGSGVPVTLIGSSGGGQVALGATSYLVMALHAPIRIVAVGGVMSGDPGVKYVTRIEQRVGSKDPVPKIGAIAFPERWPVVTWSDWNQAIAQGKYAEAVIGPMAHAGAQSYLDANCHLANGQSYVEHTSEALVAAMGKMGLPTLTSDKPASEQTAQPAIS